MYCILLMFVPSSGNFTERMDRGSYPAAWPLDLRWKDAERIVVDLGENLECR